MPLLPRHQWLTAGNSHCSPRRVATNSLYASSVRDSGLEFYPLESDPYLLSASEFATCPPLSPIAYRLLPVAYPISIL